MWGFQTLVHAKAGLLLHVQSTTWWLLATSQRMSLKNKGLWLAILLLSSKKQDLVRRHFALVLLPRFEKNDELRYIPRYLVPSLGIRSTQ